MRFVLAIGLLVMMYPILCKVRYETLHQTFRSKQLWIQVGFSVFVNWIVAPFLMVSLSAKCSSDITRRYISLTFRSLHWHGLSCLMSPVFARV
jgi:ACR3 family arsenite efflux pump ArsB